MAFGIRDAEIVREIARRGGFRAAASALGLAPSAVSVRVAGLEARLGVALFERTGRGARPTPQGRRFLEECARLIALRDRIAADLATEGDRPATLRIGVAETVVHAGLPLILRRLAEALPRLRTEVSTATSPELAAGLDGDALDAAICLEGSATGAVLVRLPPFAMGWFAAEPAVGAPWDAAALARRPIITFAKGTEPQRAVERLLADPALPPPLMHANASLSTVVHLTLGGLGVGTLPRAVVAEHAEGQRLHEIPVAPAARLEPLRFVLCARPDLPTGLSRALVQAVRGDRPGRTDRPADDRLTRSPEPPKLRG